MAKSTGLGNNLFVDGYELGGDVGRIDQIACPMAVQEVPGIKHSAQVRIGLKHDGVIAYNAYFNPDDTAGAEGAHVALSGLPTADRIETAWLGTGAAGDPACSIVTKQIDYGPNREESGALTFAVNGQANGYGLDWGVLLDDSPREDTSATTPTEGVDLGASPTSYSQGWVAYAHLLDFSGTSVTLTLADSADNASFTNLTGGAFTAMTDRGAARLASSSATATVRRYVRVSTSGTFTVAKFLINFVRYEVARS